MKKNMKNLVWMLLLAVTPIFAESTILGSKTYSLVGIEAGYNGLSMSALNDDGTPAFDETTNYAHAGIKIGAQNENYRIFLSARYNKIDDFDYAYTMGVEFQYLINFSKHANLFLGAGMGMAEMEYLDDKNFVRTISDPYVGGDIGVNYHVNESIDLELGVRLISLDANNLKNDITYTFDTITTGYTSVIFKF